MIFVSLLLSFLKGFDRLVMGWIGCFVRNWGLEGKGQGKFGELRSLIHRRPLAALGRGLDSPCRVFSSFDLSDFLED